MQREMATGPHAHPGRSDAIANRAAAYRQADWLREQTKQRRANMINMTSIGMLCALALLLVDAFVPAPQPASITVALLAFIGTATAFTLNKQGKVELAGTLLVGVIASGLAAEIVLIAYTAGLALADLRFFDLFALPVLLAALIINQRGLFVVACLVSVFSLVALTVLPKERGLLEYMHGGYHGLPGSWLDVVAIALLFPWLIALASWMGADAARRGLTQASRADDLARANERILAQSRELEAQRRTLHDGLAHIQQVHSAVARGQWETRVQIENGELLPMAISLNLLLDRITRLSREQQELARVEAASRELARALRSASVGRPYSPPHYTGTAFDEVLVELAKLRRAGRLDSAPEAGSWVADATTP